MLKSEWHYFSQICWSLWRQLSSKRFLLEIGKISGLFFNTLTADQKYCLPNRQFDIANWDAIISKRENFFSSFFFWYFSNVDKIFKIFKKKMALIAAVFSKLRTRKTFLDKCLKSRISEDLSKSNIVNGSRQCSNLNHSTFDIFIDHFEGNWIG